MVSAMNQRTLAIVGVVIFLSGLFGGVALEKFDVGFSTSNEPSFSIEVDNDIGSQSVYTHRDR